MIFALLFFKKIVSFNTSRKGGSVVIDGSNFIIALAPYFFPLISIPVILVKPYLGQDLQIVFNGILGFTLAFHFVYFFKEFHFGQPDLKTNGLIFSSIVILFFNFFFVGLSVASLYGSWGDIIYFLELGATETLFAMQDAISITSDALQTYLP